MDISRVKFNLGRTVEFDGREYTLTACIMRNGDKGFYFQAELRDFTAASSLIIANLSDVKEKEDN